MALYPFYCQEVQLYAVLFSNIYNFQIANKNQFLHYVAFAAFIVLKGDFSQM